MSDTQGCAHLVVRYQRRDYADGTSLARWYCMDCGAAFLPLAAQDNCIRELEADLKQLREERRLLEKDVRENYEKFEDAMGERNEARQCQELAEAACAAKHEALLHIRNLCGRGIPPECAGSVGGAIYRTADKALADNPGAGLLEVVEAAENWRDNFEVKDSRDALLDALAALGGGNG